MAAPETSLEMGGVEIDGGGISGRLPGDGGRLYQIIFRVSEYM